MDSQIQNSSWPSAAAKYFRVVAREHTLVAPGTHCQCPAATFADSSCELLVAGRMRCVEGEMHTRTAGVLSSKLGARVRATKAASNSAHGQPRATNPLTKKSNNNRDRTAHGFLYLP